MCFTRAASCSGLSATTIWMVEQLGLAMMPLGRCSAASMFTSGTTSGTSGSMRQALELSITTAPRAAAAGPSSREADAPALKRAMSMPLKASGSARCTSISPPRKGSFCPADRAEASATTRFAGKCLASSVRSISRPTTPVAPTTATTFVMVRFLAPGLGRGQERRGIRRRRALASPAVRGRSRVSAVALVAVLASCGGKAQGPVTPPAAAGTAKPATSAATSAGEASGLITEVHPSRLLPELVGPRGVIATEQGQQRVLVDRMRLVARPDGSMDCATDLLPGGNVQSIALPSRLGGGYLFHVNAGGGTEMWRAAGWLDKLRPLTRRNEVVSDVVPGFDRLYVRLSSGNRVIALNPETGDQMPLGPLPAAGSYGQLAFADGWRAVVDTDLRGPLATFDAGLTWRPLGVAEKPQAVGIFDGDPAVIVNGGRYVVDARGLVSHRTDSPRERRSDGDEEPLAKKTGPLGKRPLRAAVEDGWPDSSTTAVVARGGALGRVSLRDGRVLALVDNAYPDARANCHAVRLGLAQGGASGIGFICGERDAATVVYAYVPPLAMRPVIRFDKPRFVSASGNGALVIRGRCEGEGAPEAEADARWYCVRAPSGATREIRVKGFDLGVERIIGLADGKVAVLVPPRGGSPGDLSIVSLSGQATKVALKLPEEPREAARQLKRGLWLDGFEERSPGVLGGWVEAGGPVVGVEIAADGTVKAGEVQAEANGAIFGGRFGVLLFDGGRAMETSDGGMTYKSFDLPDRDDEARAAPTRAAGPVGAALPGWIRVGWGEPETPDDMKQAESPIAPHVPLKVSPTIGLTCDVASVSTPPLPEKPRPTAAAPPPPPRGPRGKGVVAARPAPRRDSSTAWLPFRNTPPPALAAEEVGVDHGVGSDGTLLRAYAWGKKGADWSRAGRWLIRFDDRFDPAGGVRSAALSASLWPDENGALEAVAGASYGNVSWTGYLDPGGRGLLAASCRGSSCALYAAGEGQPVLPVRDAAGRISGFTKPFPGGAVRVGDTWFYLGQSPSNEAVTLWRVDLGVSRPLGTYFRPTQRYGYDTPRLVRRAFGGGVGILVAGQPDPGERTGSWHVLPVNVETGELGESVALARRDFAGLSLGRCGPEQDGWVLDVLPDTAVSIDLENARAQIDAVEMRVRLDPGRACIDGFAGRAPAFFAIEPAHAAKAAAPRALTAAPGRKGTADAFAIPLAISERGSGRRWGLTCKLKPRR
ncbi:MAG: hypothetical protein QM820_42445 [Minicystis sp.]